MPDPDGTRIFGVGMSARNVAKELVEAVEAVG